MTLEIRIVGEKGSGKTRLANKIAAMLTDSHIVDETESGTYVYGTMPASNVRAIVDSPLKKRHSVKYGEV